MNNSSEQTYQLLFDQYDCRCNELVAFAKEALIKQIAAHPQLAFRSDAAIFLLVNIDYMLIQPIESTVTNEEMRSRLDTSIAMLFDTLSSDANEELSYAITTREILRAADRLWVQISTNYCPWW